MQCRSRSHPTKALRSHPPRPQRAAPSASSISTFRARTLLLLPAPSSNITPKLALAIVCTVTSTEPFTSLISPCDVQNSSSTALVSSSLWQSWTPRTSLRSPSPTILTYLVFRSSSPVFSVHIRMACITSTYNLTQQHLLVPTMFDKEVKKKKMRLVLRYACG